MPRIELSEVVFHNVYVLENLLHTAGDTTGSWCNAFNVCLCLHWKCRAASGVNATLRNRHIISTPTAINYVELIRCVNDLIHIGFMTLLFTGVKTYEND